MKIMTVVGTRPEVIRLSRIIPKLDNLLGNNHILVHTGQNYDKNLKDIFFKELKLRNPNIYIGAKGSFGEQIGIIMRESEKILKKYKPDKVLILGDTNTGLVAYIAERLRIPVYHMEAGNRCWDKKVPEEVNRRMIDHISTYNFPYTKMSSDNLLREGLPITNIIISGNPIYEVMKYNEMDIENSSILDTLNLVEQGYFLSTFHRSETVDIKERLEKLIKGLELVAQKYNKYVICSIHPRTKSKLDKWNIKSDYLIFLKPIGFFDFIQLEQNALCVLSDSGTVCEETCILKVPNIIIRDSTERPEAVIAGASMVSGIDANKILECTNIMLSNPFNWTIPKEYLISNVSDKIIKYISGRL